MKQENSFQALGEVTHPIPPGVIFLPLAAITFRVKQRAFVRNIKSSLMMRMLCHGNGEFVV